MILGLLPLYYLVEVLVSCLGFSCAPAEGGCLCDISASASRYELVMHSVADEERAEKESCNRSKNVVFKKAGGGGGEKMRIWG